MRAIATVTLLLVAAMPAVAHAEDHDLDIEDLVLTFNPLTQATEFRFDLHNDHATLDTGAIWSTVTLNGQPVSGSYRVSSEGLEAGTSGVFTVSVPLRVGVAGCITVFSTKVGTAMSSEAECATTSGVSGAAATIPTVPSAPEVPGVPEVPEQPPTLPEAPPATLP